MREPKRNSNINSLWGPFGERIELLLKRMVNRGFDPMVFEAHRSEARQEWLYGIGRTHSLRRKPVTWTHHSKHLVMLDGKPAAKGVDIISKEHGWNSPSFYAALRQEALKIDGLKVLDAEQCHVEWQG